MNRRSRLYHQWMHQALGEITARKKRLLRIHQNAFKRRIGLLSKRQAEASFYRDQLFVGRDGWPISTRAYMRHQAEGDYLTVACDWYKAVKVSTVWMGKKWPTGWSEGDFFLFETTVFVAGKGTDSRRYKTEAEARKGHAFMLAAVKKKMNPIIPGKSRTKAQQEIDETFRRLLQKEVDCAPCDVTSKHNAGAAITTTIFIDDPIDINDAATSDLTD